MNYSCRLVKLLSLILLCLSPLISSAQPTPFSKIIFFGDSLTDNGNFYSDVFGFMPKSPPYFFGRFSNGPVWSEHVALYYQKNAVESVNYAIGGQTAVFHNPFNGYQPYTLTLSLDNYLLRTFFQDRENTLFIIWIGANDYLPGIENLDELSSNVVNSIQATIESLIYHGGKNFLVINLPDLSKTPFAKSSNYAEDLKNAVIVHNLKLDGAISVIQDNYKNINIHLYNINTLLTDFMANTAMYNEKYNKHIIDTISSCWNGGYTFKQTKITEELIAQQIDEQLRNHAKSLSESNTNKLNSAGLAHYIITTPALFETYKVSESETSGLTPCKNPDDYMFWDHIHPTAEMHNLIAIHIISYINQNYQPTLGL